MEPISRVHSMRVGCRRFVIGFLLLAGIFAHPAQAQEVRLEALVEFIAGENIYLNIGADEGIQESDTLLTFRGEEQLGILRVVAVTASRTVTAFAGDPFAVTRGDELTVVVGARVPADQATPEPVAEEPDQPERRSVFERGTTGVQLPPVEEGIRFSGRIALAMDVMSTTTEGLTSDFSRTRNYQIPSINLRGAVEEIPGDLRININTRFAQRNDKSRLGVNPTNSLRLYQLNVERAVPGQPFQARLGRFYNPAETFSGFWDGVGVAYQPDTGFGGGALAGFQPERANELFTDEFPKYTLFGTFAHRSDDGLQRYNASVSFHQVMPTNQLFDHTFVGLAHTFRKDLFRIRNMIQLDQDPITNEWTITRMQLYGIVPVNDQLTLRARYLVRKPYQIFRTENVIGYQRDRISGGFTLRAFSGVFSADLSTNNSDIADRSITVTTFASIPQVSSLDLGVSTQVHYWRRQDNSDVIYIAPAVSRTFGQWYTQLQYQYQKSSFDVISTTNHALEWSFNFPIATRFRSSIRLQSRWGDMMSMYRVYTTLWMRI